VAFSASAAQPLAFLDALCCPDDGADLRAGEGGPVCVRCKRGFPVEDGILRMPPLAEAWDAGELADIESERRQRDLEARHYDRLLGLRLLSLFEIPATLRPLRLGPAACVLEVGCGTGRFTTRLAVRGSAVVAVDHSLASLQVLRRKLRPEHSDRVCLVQGSATCLPVRAGWATHALACQMLEHLPSSAMRAQAVAELSRVLAPAGRAAVSAYWHTPGLRGVLRREGRHSGAIFFHRFDRREFGALLETDFHLRSLTGFLIYILLAHCQNKD